MITPSQFFRRMFSAGIFCLLLSLHGIAEDIKTKSTITAVTVYNDQALITRTAKENIPAGTHKVIIEDLPVIMIDQSVKVSGISDHETKISDIKIEQLFLDTIPETRMNELYKRLNTLRLEKNSLERTNLLYKSQFDAVEALRENYTRSLSGPNTGQKVSVEEWDKLLQFVEKKKSEFTVKMESVRLEIDSKQAKIKAVEEEIKTTGGASKKVQKQVVVILNASKAGSVILELSYLIPDAGWIPTYEARVTSTEKSLQLVYSGNVRQSSGEDWNNVEMILSTAQPAISGRVPVLSRWTVDTRPVYNPGRPRRSTPRPQPRPEITLTGNTLFGQVMDYQTKEPLVGASVVLEGTSHGGSTDMNGDYIIYNIPEGRYSVRVSLLGYQPVVQTNIFISKINGARQTFSLESGETQLNEVVITSERPTVSKDYTTSIRGAISNEIVVNQEESVSSMQMTSSIFTIQSKQSIPSDNQNHKVGIAIENIPIDFTYDIVPKLMQNAFLTGKGKNLREYPLLAGDANVFLDNSFVATVSMKTTMPNDSFSVNLGVDEAIRVERKLINRFSENVGTFSTKRRITYEFENSVQNHKKYPVEITLFEHVPVSRDEKIVVEILEPNAKTMVPNVDGIFKWKMNMAAGEKKIVKLKFAVEFPPELVPYGLE